MNQNCAPLWTALVDYHRAGVVPFHTPGHKLRPGAFSRIETVLGPGFFALDPSDEIENIAIEHDFEQAVHEAERLAAELFGATATLFLVNGTTGGLHYLLMPTTGRVLIPRFSHQAIYSALVLAEAQAHYLPVSYDPDWLIPLPPSPVQIETALSGLEHQALVLTHPTYYGTTSELAELTALAHKWGVLVFVDEAHGGHFHFSRELPASGLRCGADAVVQSTHKTLGSFTQTSMLHSQNELWFSKVRQARHTLQTTSPSLVFLAVLDEVRRELAERGQSLVTRSLELARSCRQGLQKIKHVELLPGFLQSDPTKVVFSLRDMGLTGIELERVLRADYNIQVELSDYYNVLALITIGDTVDTVEKLVHAVRSVVQRRVHLGGHPLSRHHRGFPELPPSRRSLRQGFFLGKMEIALEKAVGRVSGDFLTPYPPGVPVIVPGEEFTPDVSHYLLWCLSIGWPIRGLRPGGRVTVLEDYR